MHKVLPIGQSQTRMRPQRLPLPAVLVPMQPLRETKRQSMQLAAAEVGIKVKSMQLAAAEVGIKVKKTHPTSTPSVSSGFLDRRWEERESEWKLQRTAE